LHRIGYMESPRLEIDPSGIGWVVFDDPNAKVNIFNPAVFAQLDKILDELQQRKPKGVVFISGKPDIFIAGADIKELEKIRDAAHGEELSRAGQKTFEKIEQLGVPTVAAINGACLGGGCEMALACSLRVATDNPKTQIGLPETQLGIIPGWGGTQRLPRLIGLRGALDIIVPGKSLNAVRALKVGLVDAVVPTVVLREAVVRALDKRERRSPSSWPPAFLVRNIARKQVLARTRGHYPAPLKAIEVAGRGFDAEARALGEVAATPQCKNLIRVYFLREKYAKLRVGCAEGWKATKVGVLGAGVMGGGIAQWCSARGLTVRLKDIKSEFVAAGMKRIADVYREGVKRRRISELDAQHGLERVHPTTEYTGFGDCDLVIEAVLEKIEVKRALFNELTPRLKGDCTVASNTSAIPIDELAKASGRPEQFVGIHFFNPVHRMPLVEVVRGTKTASEVVGAAVEFAKQLKKIPIVVRGSPGFLVNRLLMPYLNEAGVMLGEGVGVEAIDKAMLDFGMPMGPLRLIDEVGIDVAFDVARELADAFKERMTVAPILQQLHELGLKGRKGGAGFYVYSGKKEQVNPKFSGGKSVSAADVQHRLLHVMIAEAKRCLDEKVVETEDDVDVGMIFGTGFPPFRGGLVKWARDTGVW
jgi:3-hydroxyacyl-CoA dehydrogenase / enoyl-CoA hydratase / 3-hydroxybutyryl-CoA epimerase